MDLLPKYQGLDGTGRPKAYFLKMLENYTLAALEFECDIQISLSAHACNNPRSDAHWRADACHDECERRKRGDIYETAYKRTMAR